MYTYWSFGGSLCLRTHWKWQHVDRCKHINIPDKLAVSLFFDYPDYLLTPWSRVLLEKLTGFQQVRKFTAFYGTRKFITVLTSARRLSNWRVMPPLETPPPPGDPSGGVFYLQIVLSPEEASRLWVFLNSIFLRGGVVSASPKPQAGGPPVVGCPRLLIQFIRSYPPYRRPFHHPQREDAPWRGDRDPQTRLLWIGKQNISHKG